MLKEEKDSPSQTNNYTRNSRLAGRENLRGVVYSGNRLRGSVLSLTYSEGEPTKFAIGVTKAYGKAVERNRIKRVIREFLRLNKDTWPDNRWLVIKVFKSPELPNAEQNEAHIIDELRSMMKRIK